MKTAAQVLGFIGGIGGFLGAIPILLISYGPGRLSNRLGARFSEEQIEAVSEFAWIAILLPIIGIVGALIIKKKPKVAGVLLLVSGIGGVIRIYFIYSSVGTSPLLMVGGILALLLLVGGFLVLVARRKEKEVLDEKS
jgi:hypothetical protein